MINIFDQRNLDLPNALEMKINALVDDKSNASFSDNESRMSSRSVVLANKNARQLALNYLKPNKDVSETSKEFVISSRQILMKEISIQDKKEETKRLIEFIQMEQEKLTESKRTFDEDKEGYERYLDQLRADVAYIEEEVKELTDIKNQKKEEIRALNERKQDIHSECGKIDDMLEIHSTNKDFIKTLADFAKIKMDNKDPSKKEEEKASESSESDELSSKEMPKSSNETRFPKKMFQKQEQNFFITNLIQKQMKKMKSSKESEKPKQEVESESEESFFAIPFNK